MFTIHQMIPYGENGEKTFWNRVGVGFTPNKDGSINLALDMFPGVKLQLRENKSDSAEPKGKGGKRGR